MDLQGAIRQLLHEQARYARGDGEPWERIGARIYGPESGMGQADLATEAFHYVAADPGDGPSSAFTCGTCLGLVHDRGPEAGSPLDAERGHAPDCARFGELVRAYNAQWEDGG
jgi:hypothetical protein